MRPGTYFIPHIEDFDNISEKEWADAVPVSGGRMSQELWVDPQSDTIEVKLSDGDVRCGHAGCGWWREGSNVDEAIKAFVKHAAENHSEEVIHP